jgi:hypothetical protein
MFDEALLSIRQEQNKSGLFVFNFLSALVII